MRAFVLFVATQAVFYSAFLALAEADSPEPSPAWKSILKATSEDSPRTAEKQFLFKCSQKASKNRIFEKGKKQAIGSPSIIVTDNQPAELESISQSPFVTGVEIIRNPDSDVQANQPIITVLDEGYKIKVRITTIDDKHVQLDAQFSLLQVDGVENVELSNCTTQAATHCNITKRVLRAAKLGETLRLEIPSADSKTKPTIFEYQISKL